MEDWKEEYLTDLLPFYYNRLFPYDMLTQWLSYGNEKYLSNREICFTLENDIYIRYLSFSSANDFISSLESSKPIKIDIGAVYSDKPDAAKIRMGSVHPMEKELVFDIDMTDYDDVRTCCTGTDICNKCWKFIRLAVKILDTGLRADFGYKHLLWIFSGRRGVHCWVCDEEARKLDDQCRSSLASYFQVSKGGNMAKKVNLWGHNIHSSLKRALNLTAQYFPEILQDQDLLGSDEQIRSFLKTIDVSIRENVESAIKTGQNSKEKWEDFVSWHRNYIKQATKESKRFTNLVEEIQLQFCYPRLDINVTRGKNHLLKSPFCIHPKTGKISIPINPKLVDKFDPSQVPTISLLLNEVNAYDATVKEQEKDINEPDNVTMKKNLKRIRDYKKTSLLKPITILDEFIRSMKRESNSVKMSF